MLREARAAASSAQGAAGLAIVGALAAASAASLAAGPQGAGWGGGPADGLLPRAAMPAWAGALQGGVAEHVVARGGEAPASGGGGAWHAGQTFLVSHGGGTPAGVVFEYTARYSGAPLLDLWVERPDGARVALLRASLPHSAHEAEYTGRVYSSSAAVRGAVAPHAASIGLPGAGAAEAVFSAEGGGPLPGVYAFTADLYGAGAPASLVSSALAVEGGAYGALGTDEMRRDVAAGLLAGAPPALFIGVTVAAGSVAAGLAYGTWAGYAGGRADAAMMGAADVVYALPALPFLIILAVSVGSGLALMAGLLVLFGWVGVARVSRSMVMQVRSQGYVEASRMMGRGAAGVIARHVLPQLLPYAFATTAISVPAAIGTEAALSFLGLGDPALATWGKMLHEASVHGAAARGLWWWVVPPGAVIAAAGLAFVLLGGAFERAVSPRRGRAGTPV